ncbi:MAG TPA: MFS transporter [Propionibacteriaceae bacterium]|nr:MFS transporter [Propionibacteriaceae bacterium]
MDPELRALLRRLLLPVYLPTMLYSGGAAAIVPVVPLVGLRLGMSVPQVALLGTLAGVLTVVGPIPTGRVVQRLGERAALICGGLVAIASILVCLGAAVAPAGAWRLWVFAGAVLVMALGDLTWDLGRQTYLADEIPVHLRARAMTLFGGMMRVGRIVGPLLGAGVIALWGAPAAFVVHLVAACVSLALVARFVTPHLVSHVGGGTSPATLAARRDALRPILLVGAAALVLSAVRTNRDLLLPLLGHWYGYHDSLVSLVFAVSSAAELVLVLPAGTVMDRYGRAAVLVPCLALMGAAFVMTPVAATVPGFFLFGGLLALGNGLGAGINKTLSADVTPAVARARWMGLWNSVSGAGSLLGPGMVAALTAVSTVVSASVATGVLGLVGAGWAAWWLPRLVPRERRTAPQEA